MPHMPGTVVESNLYAELHSRLASVEAAVNGGISAVVAGSVSLLSTNVLAHLDSGRTAGVTDDRAGIGLAIAAAASSTVKSLYFPPGVYRISKYVDIAHAGFLRVVGRGARIIYPSDDTSLVADGTALSSSEARSAFLVRYCSDVIVEGITFHGGDDTTILVNLGTGIHARHTVSLTLEDCNALYGGGLVQHDTFPDTTGTGDTIAVNGSTVTLTDSAGTFQQGHATGTRTITISDSANPTNCCSTLITGYNSASSITFENADAVPTTSSFRWSIDDGDRTTRVRGGWSYGQRSNSQGANDTDVDGHVFMLPDTADVVGIGSSFSVSGTTVTLSSYHAKVGPKLVGRYLFTKSATSAGNNTTYGSNGPWLITSATAMSGNSPATIVFTNASGVTEVFPGEWWVPNGEKVGVGAGASALTKSGNTMTLTSATPAFTAADATKNIRLAKATSSVNNNIFAIDEVVSPTQVRFTNASGTAEDFYGHWTIDSYDRTGDTSSGRGSTHFWYNNSGSNGRDGVRFRGCVFANCRELALKFSGTAKPLANFSVIGNVFYQCANVITFGADDSQEHNGLISTGNFVIDCAKGRPGWATGSEVQFLGSRNCDHSNNSHYYTQNHVNSVSGTTMSSIAALSASRYLAGNSQPCEGVSFNYNKFKGDPRQTTLTGLFGGVISATRIGQIAYWGTTFTLTKSGNTMTLTYSAGKFSPQLVGRPIELVFTPSGTNDIEATIESVPSSSTLTFTNAAGAAGTMTGATFRIYAGKRPTGATTYTNSEDMGGTFTAIGNTFNNICATAISTTDCIAPQVSGNTWIGGGTITDNGSMMPWFEGNRSLGATNNAAQIQLTKPVWPVSLHNRSENVSGFATNISARDMTIGLGSTVTDFPLLGVRGRNRATNGFEEFVVAYGPDSCFVDGDHIDVNGTVYTYKASAPSGNQFNSFTSLKNLIDAQAGFICTDYGDPWSIATLHLRIQKDTRTTSDGTFYVRTKTLNPNVLVMGRNQNTGGGPFGRSRGSASAGPIPDAIVAWSHLLGHTAVVGLYADNAAARGVLAGSYMSVLNVDDSGCCRVLRTANRTDDGALNDLGGEYRWAAVSW